MTMVFTEPLCWTLSFGNDSLVLVLLFIVALIAWFASSRDDKAFTIGTYIQLMITGALIWSIIV